MVMATLNATGTSLGTGTTKTQLNGGSNVTMPAWARELVAIAPYAVLDTVTGDESLLVKIALESDDVAINPFEVLANPVEGADATSGESFVGLLPDFPVHCPLKGGEEIAVYGTCLASNTAAPYAGVTMVVADRRTGRQKFAKVGTLTGTGTAAAEVAGTAYSIHGSERIVEVYGTVKTITKAASNPIVGYIRLQSNDFKVAVPLKYAFQPISGALGGVGCRNNAGIKRFPVEVPTNTTCTVQDYANFDLAPASAGSFITGILFEKVGRN